jgi:hypothetical protein
MGTIARDRMIPSSHSIDYRRAELSGKARRAQHQSHPRQPKIAVHVLDAHENLIQVPPVTAPWPAATQVRSD